MSWDTDVTWIYTVQVPNKNTKAMRELERVLEKHKFEVTRQLAKDR